MVKKTLLVACITLVTCCIPTRNEYKNLRVSLSRFSIKPNTNKEVYQLIDTSCVYLNTRVNGQERIKNSSNKYIILRELNNVIKFYGNGRVGMFLRANLEDINSLNPKKANMGLYNLSNKGFFIQFISHSPQAGIFFIKEIIQVKGDTILISDKEYKFQNEYVKLKKLKNEQQFFIPDW